MARTLGLDIGTNSIGWAETVPGYPRGLDLGNTSIGWAEVEQAKLVRSGVRIFPLGPIRRVWRFSLPVITKGQAAKYSLFLIAVISFTMAAFFDPQFSASVAFSALIAWLSLIKE